jgi:serine/threonine-protein kinase
VNVQELGELDGANFLVMEYVHGVALNQLLEALARQQRALTPELAAFVAMQIADGLHAAHETENEEGEPLGIVHRDVSPQNVLLSYKGQ